LPQGGQGALPVGAVFECAGLAFNQCPVPFELRPETANLARRTVDRTTSFQAALGKVLTPKGIGHHHPLLPRLAAHRAA
jgi:hypothetical protein